MAGIFLRLPAAAQPRPGSPRMGLLEVLLDKCNKWKEEQGSDGGGGLHVSRK